MGGVVRFSPPRSLRQGAGGRGGVWVDRPSGRGPKGGLVRGLVYVYAILDGVVGGELWGIEGGRVRWIEEAGLAAAVSDVPRGDFDEEPLNARIRDLAWLGPRAEAHQAVNAQLAEQAEACLPLAFGTVFRTDDRVRELLSG